ncbi:hypothetical protein F5B22DRAFT_75567 [Xylaria bambusicola]|uniref:uncharacterized protein n=1 Tax=Xylaria bambusicola TaxID=326684 RepID=UPI0020078D01|nr:uncharacterized protein F5B22DRAFT_75567 [Xylaria bambusicola]KAI0518193.1 hypothetical protein F5B22DRAFT_75567 [Xylaria bambusicola]
MSGEGPESIPTSADPRSKRPTKKRALTPVSAQAKELDVLFAHPDHEIRTERPNTTPRLAAPPEIVTNVQGSSAGAGSGEFHVYKASRRREYERLRRMDEEVVKETADAEFERGKEERLRKDDEKTRRNREKRDKKRKARERAKNGAGDGGGGETRNHNGNQAAAKNGTAGPISQNGVKSRIELKKDMDDREEIGQGAIDQPMEETKGIVIEDD